ncbi:MAG: pantoate--beta-alanine ligase [Bacteroidota bacterium]|nr:pantoate--beta-alanine ligase [Candidatus Kapabacteria bacterium]MDW8074756.1 pantoate--beta-alanine ligase [Bacteroidota bacterium]MDW8271395.1 pantoate--beta-alanine ligase [Bacteroidota bacterium]
MLIEAIAQMQQWSEAMRTQGNIIGLVPTMGFLHEGHCALIKTAAQECSVVITTVFVNPLQFGPSEDFARYPRDLERDIQLATQAGATVVFAPTVEHMYPAGYAAMIDPGPIAEKFEGIFRPGHFRGVATVVAKLFNITKPHVAYFGQKDYQQTLVISQLIRDLNFDIRMRVLPTVRQDDGLALSSRNVYLSPQERQQATILYRALQEAEYAIRQGERRRETINTLLRHTIEAGCPEIKIEYAAAATAETLEEPEFFASGSRVVLLLAVRLGTARLIDNSLVEVP